MTTIDEPKAPGESLCIVGFQRNETGQIISDNIANFYGFDRERANDLHSRVFDAVREAVHGYAVAQHPDEFELVQEPHSVVRVKKKA